MNHLNQSNETADKIASIREIRRDNLRRLCKGKANEVALALGWSESRLSQIIGPNPIRHVTENVQLHIESTLGLSEGWLNVDRASELENAQ